MRLLFSFAASALLVIAAGAAHGQDASSLFRKAPPEVEESLQQTVRKFLDLQMEKKWGESIKFIAEESLDTYISSDKFTCRTMEVFNVTYANDFGEATVGIFCERGFATPVGGGVTKMPYTTMWKRVDGDWKWFTPGKRAGSEDEYIQTPFGPMRKPKAQIPADAVATPSESGSSSSTTMGPAVQDLQGPLRIEPARVIMRAEQASSATAKVRNTFPGLLKLDLRWVSLDGLTATLSHNELQSGETAEISVRFEPPGLALPPRIHAVWLESNPMRSATPLIIEFQLDEEVEKKQGENPGN
ncbi:MAG: hypothetical protein KIT83_12295 [Bryobacterales bacterium]|nr:hypothetical protein [Bryobacterales bacterium]